MNAEPGTIATVREVSNALCEMNDALIQVEDKDPAIVKMIAEVTVPVNDANAILVHMVLDTSAEIALG
jgi:hypothetical protein